MWCFCRKRSSVIEDEQSEEFIRIACNNSVESEGPDNHKSIITSDSFVAGKYNGKNETRTEQCEIYDKGKEYDKSEIYCKFISQSDADEKITSEIYSAGVSSSNVVEEVGMKMHKVEIHSHDSDNLQNCEGKITKLKIESNDAVKFQEPLEDTETSFSNHCTQTENGVLPAPLMKRREKTKSSELTENQLLPRNSPLDLSQKCVPNLKESGNNPSILQKQKQKNLSNKFFYENLPPGSEDTQKNLSMPLDLSLGSSAQKQGRESKCSNLISLHLELSPLNLSKKSYVSTETASPSSFGRSYNGELSPLSMETNNTQCFSTTSSRPDLLSNVDNDDYKFNDLSKISYFNAVYDKSSIGIAIPISTQIISGQSPYADRIRVLSPPSLCNGVHYNSESVEITKPKMAHSGSYVHSSSSSQHWQLQSQDHPLGQINETLQQYSVSNICLNRHPILPHPIPAHCHPNRNMSNSNSLHSVSNHSMNNSYYNPSYQNHTLDGDASYAVLDDVHKKPLYDNLKPTEDIIYEIYDDQNKKGPLYANVSSKPENLYFAYDNNTYIPPHRLKTKENTYENDDASIPQADHTYSTIGSPIDSSQPLPSTLPTESTSASNFDEASSHNKPSDPSCSKSHLICSDSVPAALNLVKVPDIPLPVKVKSSSNGRSFMRNNKNSSSNGIKSSKLNQGSNKNNNKFGYKSRSKIKEITLVESSGSILDELLSPSISKQDPQMLQNNKKPSLTSLISQQQNSDKMGPSLEACGKKFSSLSDMKKNSASPLSASSTPKSKNSKSGRSLLSSFSFRGDKKQPVPKSESSRLLDGKNKWNNSSAASLGSIASLASSSSSLSNYIHPPSIASEGGLLSNCRDEFDCGILILPKYSTPPCLAANGNDSVLLDNFRLLRECPWYWGSLDVKGAEEMLSSKQDGSFLVRDSSDEGCIVSLTFRSLQMTHHTRIEYKNGTLSFHIPVPRSPQISSTPSTPSSPSTKGNIIEFMIRAMEDSIQNCNNLTNSNACWLYLERSGPAGTSRVPVKLFYPISKWVNKDKIPSLKCLSRKLVVRSIKKESINLLPLSHWLKAYLLIEFI